MIGTPLNDTLHSRLMEMVEHERSLRAAVRSVGESVRTFEPVAVLLRDIERTAADHLLALRERIESGGREVGETASTPSIAPGTLPGDESGIHRASRTLSELHGLLSAMLARYAIIMPIANRVKDSPTAAQSGTTTHLARGHLQDHTGFVARINEMLQDLVIWELDEDRQECACTCPACGLGLCVCSTSSRSVLNEAWSAATPHVAEQGLEVQLPRRTSSARAAGFMRGDAVVGVDGNPVKSTAIIQKTVRDHEPNARIDFEVRRRGDLVRIIAERWSDTGVQADENLVDCIVPPNPQFFTDQARDARDRLRDQVSGRVDGEVGLTELTPREVQVLRLVARGADNPMIGDELDIKRATVARHISNILAKLGATNRAEAAALAADYGLLPRR